VSATARTPDTPGWQVRVVPNLYPAFERQEVVVSAPRHARSFAELNDAEVALVAAAWRQRAETARGEGFPYVHALLNEGRIAGSSLPHSHSQLVWLRDIPELVASERTAAGACGVCELLRDERYRIREQDGVASLVHPAGRLPYEILVAPLEHDGGGFESGALAAALALLADAIRRLYGVEGAVPLNAWLHDNEHWHLELLPRLSVLAGVELGAGLAINSLPPEDATAALRA
jgi:UDPglucose--hexose-1-phosphate uridylyltransferase